MEKQPLVLKFKNKEAEYSFENKINIVQEKEFLNILSRPNYKNQNSSLVIKSMNNLAIADVIQIKVNISSVGSLFTNFIKEDFNEETGECIVRKKHTLMLFDENGKSHVTGSNACYKSFERIVAIKRALPTREKPIKVKVVEVPAQTKGHNYLKLQYVAE